MPESYLTGRERISAIIKYSVAVLLIFFYLNSNSQDLRLFSVANPTTGCMLGNQEDVSIVIINVGPQLVNATFDATFILNNGTPVTENVMLPPVFNNGSLISYTFSSTADLSITGNYILDAYINLPSDINRSNDTISSQVISYPMSAGGVISGGTTVCSGVNSGQLILSGHTGDVINWESSTDGLNWNVIPNTSAALNFSNLNSTTIYRAVVKSGTCQQQESTPDTVYVDPLTAGGTISGGGNVCPGNSGVLNLTGYTGSVLHWEISTDNGSSWTTVANTTSSQNYSSVTTNTLYRAYVESGVCGATYSQSASLILLPSSAGGITTGSDTVCSGGNNGMITLGGHTGNTIRWEKSTDAGATWTNISNTTASLSYSNLVTTTQYRALVESCAPAAYSSVTTITVRNVPSGGTLTGNNTVCASSNSGNVTLTGYSGNISWQESPDGVNWSGSAGSLPVKPYSNLNSTIYYRAKVSSFPCPDAYSNSVKITVSPASVGGTLSGTTTECITSNSGTITLNQHSGNILNWEESTDNGNSWSNIINTSVSQNYLNLTQTTLYRARVQSGVCASAYSDTAIITVVTAADAGMVTGEDTVCYNSTSSLSLTNYSGSISKWEHSIDNGTSWITDIGTLQTHTSIAVTSKTLYRVVVTTGTCPADTTQLFSIHPVQVIAAISADTTITSGETITLTASGGDNYSWQPASLFSDALIQSPTATLTETTTFTAVVSDTRGCSDTAYVTVIVSPVNIEFMIPNLISPNSDGINDVWEIRGIKGNAEVLIFNSNGQVIYNASPYVSNWNAQYNGAVVPDGVYYYKLTVTDASGNPTVYKGNLNVRSR